MVIPDREVVEVADDTPPRAEVVERAGTDGGGGGVVLEETLRAAVPEATLAAGPEMATQGVPAPGSSEEVLAASRAAAGSTPWCPSREGVELPCRSRRGAGAPLSSGLRPRRRQRWTPSVAAC